MTKCRPHSRTGRSSAPFDPRPAAAVPVARGDRRGAFAVAREARSALPALHRAHAQIHAARAARDPAMVRCGTGARAGLGAAALTWVALTPEVSDHARVATSASART